MFWYDTCAIECEQDVMATFLRGPCLFLTLWIAGSQRPAIARTVVSDPFVTYTGRPRHQTYRGAASRREGFIVRTGARALPGKAETTLGSAGLAARATGEDVRQQLTLVHFQSGRAMRQDSLPHQSVRGVHMNRPGRE
jgi:hypothetical protein